MKNETWYEDTRRERLAFRPIAGEFINDWLMVRRRAIPNPQEVIDFCETLEWGIPVGDDARSCEAVDLRLLKGKPGMQELDAKIFRAFSDALQDYSAENPFLKVSSDEGYIVLRYSEGQKCLIHSDTWHEFDVTKRIISGLIMLNDNFEGGELRFPRQNITVKSEPGMAILFPSTFAMPHEVTPVTKGKRYAILTWMGVL